ncbi:related to zinc finger protein [Phialocephala subalpina]|uniref:Related to zinc finger protein n=1 Tax=Phialocephala subalpina TaxID=576137 RepID=A0A1L7XVI4_9HELO|nr:related to zinc finger protein [Phialocephala subalpina]
MPYFCDPCKRWFNDLNGYQMHIQNGPAHRYRSEEFECGECTRTFSSANSLHQHCSSAAGHPYCIPCKRMFMNQNNLNQASGFTTAAGVTSPQIHLESGTCPKANIDRHGINRMIQQLDTNHVITKMLLTYPDSSNTTYIATDRSWNGRAYQCYLCSRQFASLPSLNNHMKSPVHEQNLYHCPGRGCGREYKLLSGLVQHVESESCGVMRFATVQQQAKSGIQNMVGRMITG